MTAPEKLGLKEKPVLETDIPGLTVQGISEADLPQVKTFFQKNAEHSGKGGIPSDEFLFDAISKAVADGNGYTDQYLGARLNGKLVAYVQATPNGNIAEPDLVELSYFVDKDHLHKKIAKAAVGAVISHEESKNKTVFAAVDPNNVGSVKTLEGLGLSESHVDGHMRRVMAKRALISEEALEDFFHML